MIVKEKKSSLTCNSTNMISLSYNRRKHPKGFRMVQNGMSYQVTYPRPGVYPFSCVVTDNHGLRGRGTTKVDVRNGKLL